MEPYEVCMRLMGLNLRRDNTYISFSVNLDKLVDRAVVVRACVRHTPSISYSLPCPHTLYSWLRSHPHPHTPSIAFRNLPPNSARTGYATEGALFVSVQLSTDAVGALRKVWLLIRPWKAAQLPSTHVGMRRVRPG